MTSEKLTEQILQNSPKNAKTELGLAEGKMTMLYCLYHEVRINMTPYYVVFLYVVNPNTSVNKINWLQACLRIPAQAGRYFI